MPWRRIISCTSVTACEQCTVNGNFRSRAAAIESRSRSSVQVSICIGETTPDSRPLGCLTAWSTTFNDASKFVRPRASFQS